MTLLISEEITIIILTFIFGLVFGSFYNVVGIRVPKGESIVAPPSHCTNCGRRLAAWELVPVLSWLFLRGKCRTCKTAVSFVYPLMELATGVFFALAFLQVGLTWELLAGLVGISVFVILSVSDMYYQRIPNVILFPSIALLMIIRIFTHPLGIATYLIGAVVGFGVLLAIAVISKGGMGYGDVKLFFFVGLFTGLAGAILTLFLSSIFGTVIGLSMRGLGKLKPRQPFPFGPSIGLAAILVYLYGSQWLTLYFHFI